MNTLFILITSFSIAFQSQAEIQDVKQHYQCLDDADKPGWHRQFDLNNKELPLIIEVTTRASHRIASHVLAILLRERLGYQSIKWNVAKWDEPSNNLDRLSCPHENCTSQPNSTINLEVWMPPGFNVESWVNRGKVVDCGPLGPITRLGIFAQQRLVEEFFRTKHISLDHWRALGDSRIQKDLSQPNWFRMNEWAVNTTCTNSKNCLLVLVDRLVFLQSLNSLKTSLYRQPNFSVLLGNQTDLEAVADRLNSSTSQDAHLFLLNWFPNTVTVRGSFARLTFPDCYVPGDETEGDNNTIIEPKRPAVCDFEVNQLTKVVWSRLQTHAPLAYSLVHDMQFTQDEYADLLKQVRLKTSEDPYERMTKSEKFNNMDSEYYQIACNWIRANKVKWKQWTPEWNKKNKLVIGAMFAMRGKWTVPNLHKVASKTVDELNNGLFKTSQYSLALDLRNLTCSQDVVLKTYLDITKTCTDNSTLIGIIAALCSDTIEPMVKLTNLQRRVVVSPTVESAKFLDNTQYQYFFRTVPTMNYYNVLLISACKHWGWKRVALLRKDDHFIDHTIFKNHNIDIVEEFEVKENKLTFEMATSNLEAIKRKHGRIIIIEYFGVATRLIMCAASKLGMQTSAGYAWFINPWLGKEWWNKGFEDECNGTELRNMTLGHFMINHRLPAYVAGTDKHKGSYYDPYTIDAVKVLAHGINQLLTRERSALSALLSKNIAEMYRVVISTLNVTTIFGQGQRQERWHVFNAQNGRTSEQWEVIQYQGNQKFAPVLNFDINSGGDAVGSMTDSAVNWFTPGQFTPPHDGSQEEASNCVVEPLRRFLGVTCETSLVIVYMIPILLLMMLTTLFIFYYRKLSQESRDSVRKPYDDLCTELADLDINSSCIVLNRRVGQGAFGLVYGGEAKRKNRWEAVAVKVINNTTSFQAKIDFLSEAKLMRDLKHENVVKLIGICLHPPEDGIYLIMEFMLFGDLKTYLLSRRVVAAQDPNHEDIRPSSLTNFALDIARGLGYLHENSLIHRDIACRNCLVGTGRIIKIADFGLTRRMIQNKADGYYRFLKNGELPIRWLSPEALQFGVYSIQSDMWAFGVVLYEIITFGVFPYDGLCDMEVVDRVKRREFSITEFLPQTARNTPVWRLIMQCCQYRIEDRYRSMSEVVSLLVENPECVAPFLTDEPPKPANVNLNALPFQPGVGACNMTDTTPKPGPGPGRLRGGRNRGADQQFFSPQIQGGNERYQPPPIGPEAHSLGYYPPHITVGMKNSASTEFLPMQSLKNLDKSVDSVPGDCLVGNEETMRIRGQGGSPAEHSSAGSGGVSGGTATNGFVNGSSSEEREALLYPAQHGGQNRQDSSQLQHKMII